MTGRAAEAAEGRALPHPAFWNPANAVTLGRIAAVPLLLLLPLFDGPTGSFVIGFGYLAISLTDLLDGWLARRWDVVTPAGQLLDPLADKILVMTALVVLVATEARIPAWGVPMVVVILGREMAVTGLRAMASAAGSVLGASRLGKLKTGFQNAALTCLLVHYPVLGIPTHALGMALLALATVLTLWSGWEYLREYLSSGPARS